MDVDLHQSMIFRCVALLSLVVAWDALAQPAPMNQKSDTSAVARPLEKPTPAKTAGKSNGTDSVTDNEDDDLELAFVPSLSALLVRAEQLKGSPLTRRQVEAIRDESYVIALPAEVVRATERRRGYADIDPEHAWEQWQKLRMRLVADKELARKIATSRGDDEKKN
ncbi:hypothetical protein [Dokdonella soli]|uniref:DUF4148 domain-containing protein n=1 Tax=Dokdonella soli TaxID=529810 RepID=A0ABN1IYT5_9GAMM